MNRRSTLNLPRTIPIVLLLALLTACAGLVGRPAVAHADAREVTIMEDDSGVIADPGPELAKMRALGVQVLRLDVRWFEVAPQPYSYTQPNHFVASDPGDYGTAWDPFDAVIRDATADGFRIDLTLVGNAPLWATGKGAPGQGDWLPNAADFGAFTRAAGTRYDGHFTPAGETTPLPAVTFWSLWNEPNFGPDIAPQALPGHPGLLESATVYRHLVDDGWAALSATGHTTRNGTILIGELAPVSNGGAPGVYNMVAPVAFLRALYCLDSGGAPFRGEDARLEDCPTTATASREFAAENPGLFEASGISDHPYMANLAPDDQANFQHLKDYSAIKPLYSSLAVIGNLEAGIDRDLAAYGVRRTVAVWDTEFGYITDPPASAGHVSPATAAAYDNWAEYISWKDPCIASFDQYQLIDPPIEIGGYYSGLVTPSGSPKPGYAAFRLPIFLPRTTAAHPSSPLEVWGEARPAGLLGLVAPHQTVRILFRRAGSRAFTPLGAPIPVSSANGSFDIRMRFPSSGTVEFAWNYPDLGPLGEDGRTETSRPIGVTVR